MNKHLLLILLGFGLIGCSIYDTGGFTGTRTESLLMAGYTMEQINKAKADGTFNDLIYYARSSGQVKRGYRKYLAEQERVSNLQVQAEQQKKYQNYLNQKIALCKSYGYTNQNLISQCVEREVNIDRQRIAAQAQQQNKLNQQNFQRQQQALSDLANIFNDMGRGTYGEQKQKEPQKVCVYKCGFDTVTTTDFICPIEISYKGQSCFLD